MKNGTALIIAAFACVLSGCATRYERMVDGGFPPAYANGYANGRGDLIPLPWKSGTVLYDQGFADGKRDKEAGVTSDPTPPAFPGR